jgi:hypothetical protein
MYFHGNKTKQIKTPKYNPLKGGVSAQQEGHVQ